MKKISIDIETYSDVDLNKCGAYRYAESPVFEILLFGYAIDEGEVKVVDLAQGEEIPEDVLDALTDGTIEKWAFNSAFERISLSRYLRDLGRSLGNSPSGEAATYLSPVGWHCSMVWAATMGLPLSLKGVGSVLALDEQKLGEGKGLIKYFSAPCTPTKWNHGRTRNLPSDDPEKWEAFKAYNRRDVEVEMAIQHKLSHFPVPDAVWEEYHIDQEINDRGVRVDMQLVENAISLDGRSRAELTAAMRTITGLDNPNSIHQLKQWLVEKGLEIDSLDQKAVVSLLNGTSGGLAEVLEMRLQLAKSSVKKYQAMENCVCADGRCRGMFQFYGANRTGRWAGRLIQLQNMPQNHLPDLAKARALVCSGDYDSVKHLNENVPDTLSQLIRTSFIPSKSLKLYIADFSAVEARIISWYSGEVWRQEVFARGGDIYCASASQMFKVPVEKHGINVHLRQKGKIAELALGYGGGVGALKAMGAIELGLAEKEMPGLVQAWRKANPHIVRFWWDVDRAVTNAVKYKRTSRIYGLVFSYQSGMLMITLPSGRNLVYLKPRIGTNRFGSQCITYEGAGPTKKWERIESYGPKFVENIIQATSRDILCHSMRALRNYSIVMHIHDELVIEADPKVSLDALCEQMSREPDWAPGLNLRADGIICDYYRKD